MSAGDTRSISTRRHVITGIAAGAAAMGVYRAHAGEAQEIARMQEAIHQETIFKASRERVYDVLTVAAEFHKVVLLSAAVHSGMVKIARPGRISREAGGSFSIFGDFITGRQIELVPNTRIVQAWRPKDWLPGVYSIAHFELVQDGSATRLVFDHTGFPAGNAEHLAQGWHENYWQPMEKVLAAA